MSVRKLTLLSFHTVYCPFKVYQFEKSAVPDTQTEKQEFAKKLTVYGVSLSEYCQSLEEATCSTKCVLLNIVMFKST